MKSPPGTPVCSHFVRDRLPRIALTLLARGDYGSPRCDRLVRGSTQ